MGARRWVGAVIAAASVAVLVAGPASAHPADPEIVGGVTAKSGEYPWMVHLSVGCGGALVASRVVLTAAHCVKGTGSDRSIMATAGSTDLRSRDAVRVRSAYVRRAPGFRDATEGNDWALIRLADELDLPTLKLTSDDDYDRGTFTVLGWGATREGSMVLQRHLREVRVPFVSDRTCGRAYEQLGYNFEAKEMLCAGDTRRGGVDACQGDSGGPLVRRDRDGEWLQVGIVSWGYGCGRRAYPGVYTQVSRFSEEIAREAAKLARRALP